MCPGINQKIVKKCSIEMDDCLFRKNDYLTEIIICSIIKYKSFEPTV
jgi:hypothetical protein